MTIISSILDSGLTTWDNFPFLSRQPEAAETSFITAVAEEEPPLALRLTERCPAANGGSGFEGL